MSSFAATSTAQVALVSGNAQATLLAIISTGLGTAVAIYFIPTHGVGIKGLFPSAVAMSLGLMVTPMAAILHQPRAILRGEYLLTLAPIYWLLLDLVQNVYSMATIENEQIIQAFFGIGLFVVMVWIGAVRRPWRIPAVVMSAAQQEFSLNAYFGLTITCFVVGMLTFAIPCNFNIGQMVYYVGQERWGAPWGRGQLGGWDAFLDHLQYFGYLLPMLTVVVSRYVGWRNIRTLMCCAMSLVMTLFLAQSGSRRVIGVVIGMALVLWVLGHQRLRLKHAMQICLAIIALLVALQIMLEYRNVGLASLVGIRTDAAESREERIGFLEQEHLRVDDNFYRLCQVIQFIPKSYPFVYHQYFLYVLVRPIPRVFWPDKPVDPGFDLPSAVGVEGVSYSYSVIGELYMSLGFIGIAIGGWFYGRLSAMARGLLTRSNKLSALVMYSVVIMALFSGMRSILELVLVSYVVLAWIAVSKLFSKVSAVRP
ncbi:MAG TPA: O-antigen polymerase [Pyrinomonadaceae bacterium]|nr:O-antigen polymerase [Pyrinomonadaceae bacterium]